MGRGMGMGRWFWPPHMGAGSMPFGFSWRGDVEPGSKGELDMLKAHAEVLASELEQVKQRIEDIERGGKK
jgi:hypothetical protein